MKVLLTGGHLTPALAIIDYLKTNHPEVELTFIGRETAQESSGMSAREREEIEKREIPFFAIETGKVRSTSPIALIGTARQVARGVRAAGTLLNSIKPDVLLSFGSYVALPVALACRLRSIPIITHEQTRNAGWSNRIIGWFATSIAITYLDSARYFADKKTVLTGLPLRQQLLHPPTQTPKQLNSLTNAAADSKLPLIYITGGSQGSATINQTIADALPLLSERFRIIHQCGTGTLPSSRKIPAEQSQTTSSGQSWLEYLTEQQQQLPANLKSRYIVTAWLNVEELSWVYQYTTLVIGRSGANTTGELFAFNLPSILIPLPHSRGQEQAHNAQFLVEQGSATILSQDDLHPTSLVAAIDHQLEATRSAPASSRDPSDLAQRFNKPCRTLTDLLFAVASS